MISRQKWPDPPSIPTGRVRADAITSDLRTRSDEISLWIVKDDSKEELEQVALAIAAGRNKIDRLDLVWIDSQDASVADIEFKRTPGGTPVTSLRDRHVDAVRLNYSGLGVIATAVRHALERKQSKRWTMKEIQGLLTTAVADEAIDIAAINPELSRALGCSQTEVPE